MPRTIDEGFRDFHTKLTPTQTEINNASSHRQSIEDCLKANFTLERFFRTGSFGNGTSISGYSDVDYFASIKTDELSRRSYTSLRKIRDILQTRFPSSSVRVDCPAVVVPFGNSPSESTEIIPADYLRKNGSHSVYDIPNCADAWKHASPETHNAYVAKVDKKLKSKCRPLVRFLKAWKYYRNVPISSFYLELRVTKYAEAEDCIVYDIDVCNVLKEFDNCQLADMNDPCGISGRISACSTSTQKSDALSKLSTARKRAENARNAERNEDTKSAFEWWDLLYDNNFPSYYL